MTLRSISNPWILALLALAIGISACGSTSEPDQIPHDTTFKPSDPAEKEVAIAATAYYQALRSSDALAVCARLSKQGLAEIERIARHSCKKVVDGLISRLSQGAIEQLASVRITKIEVHDKQAQVTVVFGPPRPQAETVHFEKERGGWKRVKL
jgi:hypothetical protein